MAADGTVRALGKCLDVAAAGTANGAKVQLYDCNGTGARSGCSRRRRPASTRRPTSAWTPPGNSSADGTRLQIWDCGGTANQKWTLG